MGRPITKYINVLRRSPYILQGYSNHQFGTISAQHMNVNRSCTSSTRLYLYTFAAQSQQTKSKPNNLIIRQSFSRNLCSKTEQPDKPHKINEDVISPKVKNKARLDTIEQFKSNVDPYLRLIRFDRPIGKDILHSLFVIRYTPFSYA